MFSNLAYMSLFSTSKVNRCKLIGFRTPPPSPLGKMSHLLHRFLYGLSPDYLPLPPNIFTFPPIILSSLPLTHQLISHQHVELHFIQQLVAIGAGRGRRTDLFMLEKICSSHCIPLTHGVKQALSKLQTGIMS